MCQGRYAPTQEYVLSAGQAADLHYESCIKLSGASDQRKASLEYMAIIDDTNDFASHFLRVVTI